MKTLIASIVLSTSLAIGTTACVHRQLTNQQVARTTIPVVAVIAALVIGALANGQRPPALQ